MRSQSRIMDEVTKRAKKSTGKTAYGPCGVLLNTISGELSRDETVEG